MPGKQAILNVAAYAALSLAGVGTCLLPDELPSATLLNYDYVEVPKIDRDQPAPMGAANAPESATRLDANTGPAGDSASESSRRNDAELTVRDKSYLASIPARGRQTSPPRRHGFPE